MRKTESCYPLTSKPKVNQYIPINIIVLLRFLLQKPQGFREKLKRWPTTHTPFRSAWTPHHRGWQPCRQWTPQHVWWGHFALSNGSHISTLSKDDKDEMHSGILRQTNTVRLSLLGFWWFKVENLSKTEEFFFCYLNGRHSCGRSLFIICSGNPTKILIQVFLRCQFLAMVK